MSDESDYMTFEEAAEFLSTTRSTLYRWLREGKVPGHKLGRQWRFLRDELDAFRRGETTDAAGDTLKPLADWLTARIHTENTMETINWTAPADVAQQLMWDAVDHGATTIHFQPNGASHQLRYRTPTGLEHLVDLDPGTFDALDDVWQESGSALRNEDQRRLYLERDGQDGAERIQVRYQRLQTLGGTRLTLRLLKEHRIRTEIADIAPESSDADTLRQWSNASHGIVLISGRSGSGKTTTAYSCLTQTAKSGDRVVFTLEDAIGFVMPGVNQVELDLEDPAEYRRAFQAIFDSDLDVLFIGSTFAPRHHDVLWDTARSAAESGHLVFVQMEADSARDAVERFGATVGLPVEELLVGAVWQELVREDDVIRARYEFSPGALAEHA